MKRPLLNLFLLAVALAVLAFFAAPGVAFFGVRSAAQTHDVNGLTTLVDFDAVRRSLRPQLENRPGGRAPPPGFLHDPVGALRRQFDDAVRPAPDVNAYLTPAALYGLTRGEGRDAADRSRPDAALPAETEGAAPWPRPRYWGVNSVRLAVKRPDGAQTIFTFERRGLYRWRLTHIGLPNEAAGSPQSISPAV